MCKDRLSPTPNAKIGVGVGRKMCSRFLGFLERNAGVIVS